MAKTEQTESKLVFTPFNDIQTVLKVAISNKHQGVIKIVKKLDTNLMVKPLPDRFSESTSLSDLCLQQITSQLSLENCLDLLEWADWQIIDELKVNCLKFIQLNIANFFADGTRLNDKLLSLPIYLLREIENFLKVRQIEKFMMLDMHHFEIEIDY
jgi:hypothetical protein